MALICLLGVIQQLRNHKKLLLPESTIYNQKKVMDCLLYFQGIRMNGFTFIVVMHLNLINYPRSVNF